MVSTTFYVPLFVLMGRSVHFLSSSVGNGTMILATPTIEPNCPNRL